MNVFLTSKYFGIVITLLLYYSAQCLFKKYRLAIFNPVFFSVTSIIMLLYYFSIDYSFYNQTANIITFCLSPAVVALGLPLAENWQLIQKNSFKILLIIFAGSLSGILSIVGIAKFLGAKEQIVISLSPRSVTAPIAMSLSESMNGIPSLTAAVVVASGILGAVLGLKFLEILRIKDPLAQGLAIGAASHGIGTARVLEIDRQAGAFSSLGMCINGIITAIIIKVVVGIFY